MKYFPDGDMSMLFTIVIFVVLDNIVMWFVQTYQDKIGMHIFITISSG